MASKRSLLDLLPAPKQRQSKPATKRPRKEEGEGDEKQEARSYGDNELYRVNLSAEETTRATPSVVSEKQQTPKTTEVKAKAEPEPEKDLEADALIMKALEEEQMRSSKGKRRTAEIEFKEISQDALKSGVSSVQREVDAIGLALKADEDEDDRVVMPDYTLSKEAHRKHQITTLYQTMKKNETKMMTKDAQNSKTKRETERKYGWR